MFLETITFLGNDVLVPVDKIQYVMYRATEKGFEIVIKGVGELEWSEHFQDEENAGVRYKMIKEILNAK